jgi:hypothetical protein
MFHEIKVNLFIMQVVDVDHVRQRAQIKLIPRIDLQAKLVRKRFNPAFD